MKWEYIKFAGRCIRRGIAQGIFWLPLQFSWSRKWLFRLAPYGDITEDDMAWAEREAKALVEKQFARSPEAAGENP